jgi:hypothetical protein
MIYDISCLFSNLNSKMIRESCCCSPLAGIGFWKLLLPHVCDAMHQRLECCYFGSKAWMYMNSSLVSESDHSRVYVLPGQRYHMHSYDSITILFHLLVSLVLQCAICSTYTLKDLLIPQHFCIVPSLFREACKQSLPNKKSEFVSVRRRCRIKLSHKNRHT